MTQIKQINQNIQLIESENNDLKYKLLNLINEYKVLKSMVINNEFPNSIREKEDKKRSFQQLNNEDLKIIKEDEPLNFNKDEIFDFIDDREIEDEEIDDDMDSPLLSRTSSPLDDDNNSLMLSLTRSTTISSISNSIIDSKGNSSSNLGFSLSNGLNGPLKSNFFELPNFSDEKTDFSNLNNQFDILKQDKYNLINDFLQEKLINNDLNYYENLKYQD
ncbi:hypothetical protein CLIB1444_18S00122 [[Candida] jaroonii]|uniref:Uncharacterized protein n=1 Tax=[Candida] jaroonii TaxID=467808 RepID=A0ACA9YF31_9ASCO|nr:hypothetical protein CLIB1444_18S00122 [[Candida] jaroonii]